MLSWTERPRVNRSTLVRALLALAVLTMSGYFVLTSTPTLGLDLKGGAQIVLETQDTDTVVADAEATDRAVEVLRRRVDALGVAEPTLTRSGENRIIIELPGVEDPAEAADAVGQTARLSFHPVLDVAELDAELGEQENGELVLSGSTGEVLRLGPVAVGGEQVGDANAVLDTVSGGGWTVSVDFVGDGQDAWQQLTAAAACSPLGDPQRRVAIVLDDEIISSPEVVASIACNIGMTQGSTQITGNFEADEAQELAALIKGGALPVDVERIEQRVVGPTLGQSAIDASLKAAIIGIAITGLFILWVYRLVGLMAAIALGGYAVIAFGVLIGLGATLTLPGLAGFVLAIGMAVDANVLVFERAREDYVDGNIKSNRKALQSGFRNALSAIADSSVTTLLAAMLLFFLASGPVRGFGITLTIGVLTSLFSALVVTRVLAEFLVSRGWVERHPKWSGIGAHTKFRLWLRRVQPNFMQYSRRLLAGSLIAVVVAMAGIAVRGLNFGVEFTGGRQLAIETGQSVDIDDARQAVADVGYPTAIVQETEDADVSVRIALDASEVSDAEAAGIAEAIGEIAGGADIVRDELIGPSLGEELQRNALIALAVALAAQLAYLAIRFRWTFSTGAVTALFQNVVLVIGIFAWLGKPIDGIFLAALLTIIGYTVNDTVVLFDRIREETRRNPAVEVHSTTNTAILNTLPRSLNTGLSTMFILVALLFLGGDSLSDFALALVIGVTVGTFSSNFTAAPIAIEMEQKYPPPPPEATDKKPAHSREDPNYGAVV